MSLLEELDALKARCFDQNDLDPELADLYLTLLNHVLTRQREDSWSSGQEFQTVLVAHSVRQLTELGIGLSEIWNLAGDSPRDEGNLLRAVRLLTRQWHEPSQLRWSRWADDVWDDCYVGLALKAVLPQLEQHHEALAAEVQEQITATFDWILGETRDGYSRATPSKWKGPGLGAAALEFAAASERNAESDELARLAIESLRAGLPGMPTEDWKVISAWHAGQVIAAWHRYRSRWPELSAMSALMDTMYGELTAAQQRGAWTGSSGPNSAEAVYCTARALTAVYLMEPSPTTPAIADAHAFLLQQARVDPPMHNAKACLNVLEALQHRVRFSAQGRISPVNLHLLMELARRLKRTGLEQILAADNTSDDVLVDTVHVAARRELERRGRSAIQPIGINDELYETLRTRAPFLGEFGHNPVQVRAALRRFFSATIDEVRSHTARGLLKDLWSRSGFLTFLPFLESVSNLEHQRAFYTRYRDHVNHELLVFVTGCYVYYKSDVIRHDINEEIAATNKTAAAPTQDAEKEFLFRWKLISTFHDVGYMFEVEPDEMEVPHLDKASLLKESLASINTFGSTFSHMYLQRQLSLTEAEAQALVVKLDAQLGPPALSVFSSARACRDRADSAPGRRCRA